MIRVLYAISYWIWSRYNGTQLYNRTIGLFHIILRETSPSVKMIWCRNKKMVMESECNAVQKGSFILILLIIINSICLCFHCYTVLLPKLFYFLWSTSCIIHEQNWHHNSLAPGKSNQTLEIYYSFQIYYMISIRSISAKKNALGLLLKIVLMNSIGSCNSLCAIKQQAIIWAIGGHQSKIHIL